MTGDERATDRPCPLRATGESSGESTDASASHRRQGCGQPVHPTSESPHDHEFVLELSTREGPPRRTASASPPGPSGRVATSRRSAIDRGRGASRAEGRPSFDYRRPTVVNVPRGVTIRHGHIVAPTLETLAWLVALPWRSSSSFRAGVPPPVRGERAIGRCVTSASDHRALRHFEKRKASL